MEDLCKIKLERVHREAVDEQNKEEKIKSEMQTTVEA
jgi:hypothetical protein